MPHFVSAKILTTLHGNRSHVWKGIKGIISGYRVIVLSRYCEVLST